MEAHRFWLAGPVLSLLVLVGATVLANDLDIAPPVLADDARGSSGSGRP